jgi:hypothetical protein
VIVGRARGRWRTTEGRQEATTKVKVYDFSGDTIEGDLIKLRHHGRCPDFAKHSP